MQHRRSRAAVALLLGLALAIGAACSGASTDVSSNATAAPPAAPTYTPVPQTAAQTPQATAAARGPAPTPNPQQQAFGLHAPLPLAGEFAVTANMDDHTLSVVPIGAAAVATTVQLDLAPRSIGVAPNSDTVLAADGSPDSHQVALATLDTSSQTGTIDIGSQPANVAGPPPTDPSGPVLVVSNTDSTVRPVDPTTHAVGAPVQLGAGPHTVSVAPGNAMLAPQVYVTNAGDGSVSVLDQKVTGVQSKVNVGGRPIGVARTVDGRLWVADGNAGAVNVFDSISGDKMDTLQIGPNLTAVAATPDGRYLVLASSNPDAALYAVDLVSSLTVGGADRSVRHLAVPSGVLALATGAEITRAYATTGDGNLIYWDLSSNSISQTIPVGHNPVALILGKVEPTTGVTASNASTGIAPSSSTTSSSTPSSGTTSGIAPTTTTTTTTTGANGTSSATSPTTVSTSATSTTAISTTGTGGTATTGTVATGIGSPGTTSTGTGTGTTGTGATPGTTNGAGG